MDPESVKRWHWWTPKFIFKRLRTYALRQKWNVVIWTANWPRYAIAISEVCQFRNKTFRKHFNLEFNPYEDGCWHGGLENGNCNIGRTLEKCLWWHFYPHETPTDAKNKFLEIVGGGYTVTNVDNSPYFIVKKDTEWFKNKTLNVVFENLYWSVPCPKPARNFLILTLPGPPYTIPSPRWNLEFLKLSAGWFLK